MGWQSVQSRGARAWDLAGRQQDLITRKQLLALGFSARAIDHRVAIRRLHVVHRGVYAVGTGNAELYEIQRRVRGPIEVSVTYHGNPRRKGIRVHRRAVLGGQDVRRHYGIRVTTPILTIIDLAPRLPDDDLEGLVGDADIRGLCTPEALRAALDEGPRRAGVARLRKLLDKQTFRLTRSKLERLFLPLAESAGLPRPLTRQWVNGFEVDFYWPDHRLVVEADSLRYHRTAAQQTEDMVRDQAHAASGLTYLRFSHWQIAHEKPYVRATLAAVVRRLGARA